MRPRLSLFRESVTVATYAGETGVGPSYGTAAAVTCRVENTRQLVRDKEGQEVISELTLFVLPADETKFTAGSTVVYGGRTSVVLSTAPIGAPGDTALVQVTCS
jgi:hypothetical protein